MTFEQFKETYSVNLNPQQEAAVRQVDGPVLLLAVPGSGKTTVLVNRLGYMVYGCGIPPEQILVMTYTVAATKDMRQRYAARFGDQYAQTLKFRTINGVSSKIINLYERRKGRQAFSLISDAKKQAALLAQAYREVTGEFATESVKKELSVAITYIKNSMLSEDKIAKNDFGMEGIPDIYRAYCRSLSDQRLMDYDDQMVYARQILLRCPDLLEEMHRRYTHLCVDEAQDTSKLQHELIRLLAQPQCHLFMVGDEDQSIYGFRAAYPEALLHFETQYPGAVVLKMEQNYRSGKAIIRTADAFIQQNRNRHPKRMQVARDVAGSVTDIATYDRYTQLKYLVQVARNCQQQTAVLYRNNESAIPLIDLLSREGIPYKVRQMDGLFFTDRVVQDICDILRLAITPSDSEAFLRVYYKLGLYLSKASASGAVDYDRQHHCGLLQALFRMQVLNPWAQTNAKALITHLTHIPKESVDGAVYRIAHFTEYAAYLRDNQISAGKAEILEMLGKNEPTIPGFLSRLDELKTRVTEGSGSDSDSRFILSTIHSSKGLEYDTIYLCDVMDGILPAEEKPEPGAEQADIDAYEEERRLFYVGMTRAKNRLSVFSFKKSSLESSFSDEIFQKGKFDPDSEPRATGHGVSPIVTRKAGETDAAQLGYVPGILVMHRLFGPGVVAAVSGDILTLDFKKVGRKKCSLSCMLEAGVIYLV